MSVPKFGFDFEDIYFPFEGIQFAIRVATLENVYGPDPANVCTDPGPDGRLKIQASSLQYAGGQRKSEGSIHADLWRQNGEIRFQVGAEHPHNIKGIIVLIRDLAAGAEEEKIESWPSPDFTAAFPEFKTVEGKTAAILPTTTRMRFRRWAVYKEYSGNWLFNLTEDEEYTKRSNRIEGSEWRLVVDSQREAVLSDWFRLLERERGLVPWDRRTDVPGWFRKVSLILFMHCESWTGYVFNTFQRQAEILEWIAQRIPGEQVLVYLPGWDGRYYWNYPIYEPSPECGGADGLKRLVDTAHKLGMHLVPMYGLIASNYMNTAAMGFGEAACRTAADLQEICDWTDWDEDLSNEPIWQSLNVGEPKYRKHLLDRICHTTDTFQTDGAMIDISGWMPRDTRHDLVPGLQKLIEGLRDRYDDFLIFGENGCEIHFPLFHLFMHASHLKSDHPFFRYCRTTSHLCEGAPGRGSNGVFEGGINPYKNIKADSPSMPFLAVVQDTLPEHSEEVEEVLKTAEEWGRRWNS